MRLKILLLTVLSFGLSVTARAQSSPYSNVIFKAQTYTATGQTGTPIQLNGLTVSSTVGSSFASGTITVTGSSLTTVTFALQGSSDGGATYYALPISAVASPGTTPTLTVTTAANSLFQVNLAGLTHVRFVTSGTFTATNVILTLTASPNAGLSRNGNGGSTVTASAMQAALVAQTGCTTAGNAWNPATNTCVAASSGALFPTAKGIVKNTSTTASVIATGDTDYQSVLSTPKVNSASPFYVQAKNVLDQNYAQFADGTLFYSAGPSYASIGAFVADNTFMCQTNQTACNADFLFNLVDKFMGAINVNHEIPVVVPQNLTVIQANFCSAWDLRCKAGTNGYATGDGRIFVPQDLYLGCKRVGLGSPKCVSEYTTNVEPIKSAWAAVPRDPTTHLYQVVPGVAGGSPGGEYVCGAAFQEYMRLTGLVASCNVWAAIVDADMLEIAAAVGDTANVTYFTNDLALLVAGIRANLINGTTGLLKAATIQNSGNDDIPSSALAVYADSSPVMAAPGILTGAQKLAVANYFNTNYSSIVNAAGYVLQTPRSGGWQTVGYIPTTGGPPYAASGFPGNQYQGGYWTFPAAWFAKTLSLVNFSQVTTMLSTYLNYAGDPALEWYDQGTMAAPGPATTPYMEAPQWAVETSAVFPYGFTYTAGVPCINKYSAVTVSSACLASGGLIYGTNNITSTGTPVTFDGGTTNNQIINVTSANAANTATFLGNTATGGKKWAELVVPGAAGGKRGWLSVTDSKDVFAVSNTAFALASGVSHCFSSGDPFTAACDLWFSRTSAGNASLDSATAGDHGGNLNMHDLTVNSCAGCGGSTGTVTYTTSATASGSDNAKLVVMNCSSACSYTLPATQPSTTWNAKITSQGGTVATIILGGADTFNGSSSVPALNSYRILPVWANTAVSTDYRGEAPLLAGSNVTFTPASNGVTLAATASGGSGTSVQVNSGTALTTANFSDSTPAAPSGSVNVKFQNSGANVSAYVPTGMVNITSLLTGTNCTISNGQCVMGSTASTFGLTSIPAGYRALQILITGQVSTTTALCPYMQFNTDTAAHYSTQSVYGSGGSALADTNASAATPSIGCISGTVNANLPGTIKVSIDLYSGTTFTKNSLIESLRWNAAGFTVGGMQIIGHNWASTSAITSVLFGLTSSNFQIGSSISIYGIP